MTDLTFTVLDIAPEAYALTPILTARLGVGTAGSQPVHAIALRCQVRIEPLRRRYSDDEAAGLVDLFGPRERWATTQQTFVWQHATALVPGFTQSTEIQLLLDCTYDFEVKAAKYLLALRDGTIGLQFLFSGTVFAKGANGFSVQQVPWNCEAHYDMPVATWQDLVELHYPNTGFVRLDRVTIDALASFRSARGLLGFDDAIAELLAGARELR